MTRDTAPGGGAGTSATGAGRVPLTLRTAAGLAALESVGLGVVGSWLVVASLLQHPRGLAIAVSSGVFVLAAGVGLGGVAWGLFRARRWSRGLGTALQLLMLPLGYELLGGSTSLVGVAMLVVAVAVLVLVLAPASTAVFRE